MALVVFLPCVLFIPSLWQHLYQAGSCSASGVLCFALKRESGEHTVGALGTDGAGTLTEQESSENRLNAECSKEAEVAEHTGWDLSVLGEVSTSQLPCLREVRSGYLQDS